MSRHLCPTCMSSFEAAEDVEVPQACPNCGAKLPPAARKRWRDTRAGGPRRGEGPGEAPPGPRRPTALVFGTPAGEPAARPAGPGAAAFASVGALSGPLAPAGGAALDAVDEQSGPLAPAPDAVDEPPRGADGSAFGLYELINRLGASDVAVTYRARDRARGRIVALKVLAPGPGGSREEVSALRDRAEDAKRLEHPNIVRVLEVGSSEGTDYVASEFVEGHTLAEFLGDLRDGLSVGEVVVLAGTLASALDHARAEGVLHGDLRPTNVILDDYGNPRLTDFGFAREYWRVAPEELKRSAESELPLPHYMAPEQLAGGGPTPRSDVYGLGALMYHMLTGSPPFPGDSLFEVVLAIHRGTPRPPGALNRNVPAPVSAIVMRCIERKPAHRFATAGELALEIDNFLRGQKVNARMPGAVTRLARALGRRWKAAAAVLLLAAASGVGAHFAARSRELAALRGPDHAAKALMLEALEIGRAGSWDAAARRLAELESDGSVSPGVRGLASARLGLAHFMAKRHSEAAAAFKRAAEKRPHDAELTYCYGIALWHAGGEMAEVARALEKSLRLGTSRGLSRSERARYRYEYGLACTLAGMKEEARAAFERVRRIDRAYKREQVARHLKRLGGGDGGGVIRGE